MNKKNKLKYFFLAALLANSSFIGALLIGGKSLMAHIKLTIFSETTKRTNEALLNKKINEKFINGKNYGFALTKSEKNLVEEINFYGKQSNCKYLYKRGNLSQVTSTDCRVYGLLMEFIPGKGGEKCGNKGDLKSKIKDVRNNIGCCSDFSETFLVFAGYLNIKAREVHDGSHTTAEYYDPLSNKWKWIDTQYKQQIIHEGIILSANEIVESQLIDKLELLDPIDKNYISNYLNISNKNLTGYTLGNNIIEVEEFEKKIRFIFPQKSLHQFISHILGIRPNYLWVRKEPDDFLNKFFKYNLIFYLIFIGIINFTTVYLLIKKYFKK